MLNAGSGYTGKVMRYSLVLYLAVGLLCAQAIRADAREELQALIKTHFGKSPVYYPEALLRGLYPDQPLAEVKMMLREIYAERPLIFQPNAHVREAPFRGKFVHVSPEGFREVRNQQPFPPAPNRKAVFLFGGSTQFGYGVRDDQTIASYLQDRLDKDFPGEFAVYNFGTGFDYAAQYRIRLETLLRQDHVPFAVITLHGLNEQGFFCGNHKRPYATFKPIERSDYLFENNLAVLLKRHLNIDARKAMGRTDDPEFGVDRRALLNPCPIIDLMFRAEKLTAHYGKRYGFKVLSVFQPTPVVDKYRQSGEKDKLEEFLTAFAPYIEASKKEHGNGFLSLLDFAGPGAMNYVDQIHYNAPMNEAISGAIFERFKSLAGFPPDGKGVENR